MSPPLQSHWLLLFFALLSGTAQGGDRQGRFENSLGMRFVPVETAGLLVSVWETRVRDFRAFTEATGREWEAPDFEQGPDHPAVRVSWGDAVAFCRWLTQKEQEEGLLPEGMRYRLPSSAEWDLAAGLSPEGLGELYQWGDQWPPPHQAGNFHPDLRVDSFPHTAPVGSFTPTPQGLYDLTGNVWEWCADPFNEALDFRVLRGASWRMRTPSDLQTRFRVGNVISLRLDAYGFRVVLDPGTETVQAIFPVRNEPDAAPPESAQE